MRQPTPASKVYAWHRNAIKNGVTLIHEGDPECGWFKRRFVKGGPWVPVEIFMVREIDVNTGELSADETLRVRINGKVSDQVDQNWTYLTPISRSEYEALKELQSIHPEMAATHAPLEISPADIRP